MRKTPPGSSVPTPPGSSAGSSAPTPHGVDHSSDQIPHGYYYQPLRDNGPFEQTLQRAGEAIGQAVADALAFAEESQWGELPSASMMSEFIGSNAGGMIGKTAGFYIDNASTILNNAQTLMNQLNDYRTWMDPADFSN